MEALEYLRILSLRNNWTLLYKPHPIMERMGESTDNAGGEYLLKNANIDEVIDCSNVVVTILSQSAYTALLRDKPVVMLGYTQLKYSDCTYEAFSKRKIELQIKRAFKYGVTQRQKERFREHTARLLKYYLLDDGRHPDFPFGRKIEEINFGRI